MKSASRYRIQLNAANEQLTKLKKDLEQSTQMWNEERMARLRFEQDFKIYYKRAEELQTRLEKIVRLTEHDDREDPQLVEVFLRVDKRYFREPGGDVMLQEIFTQAAEKLRRLCQN